MFDPQKVGKLMTPDVVIAVVVEDFTLNNPPKFVVGFFGTCKVLGRPTGNF